MRLIESIAILGISVPAGKALGWVMHALHEAGLLLGALAIYGVVIIATLLYGASVREAWR